jgi:sugar/nucleoside kinase (ribokinase family)
MINKSREISIIGVGNPLMDIITPVAYDFLAEQQVKPRTMNLVDEQTFLRVYGKLQGSRLSPGGSCANTLKGFAFLAAGDGLPRPVYIGAVGDDDIGRRYISNIRAMGVESRIVVKQQATGASLILVTPDSERTMLTNLGACRSITADDVELSLADKAAVLHFTGYQWDTENQKQLVKMMAQRAKTKGVMVSFDLADPFVVERYREEFLAWIPHHVDLLFGNFEEYSLLVGSREQYEDVLSAAKGLAEIVIMKTGSHGAYYCSRDEQAHCPGFAVKAVDTTGAGDAFAGGFLYGLFKDLSLRESVRLANRIASLIVSTKGCDYDSISWSKDII